MGVAHLNPSELRESAKRAANLHWSSMGELRLDASSLEVRPLARPSELIKTIGVVAADAGLVSVELNPFSLEFLYVADSRGRSYFAEVFPLSSLSENLTEVFCRSAVLQNLLDELDVQWQRLSWVWERQQDDSVRFPDQVHLVADCLRELAEWAVALELSKTEAVAAGPPPSLVVLHDGFLASILLRDDIIGRELPTALRRVWRERGVVVAGVGKSSVLWQRIVLALDLDPRSQGGEDFYVVIPKEVEMQLLGRKPGRPRLGFGRLFLLKNRETPPGFFLPVDLPDWLVEDRSVVEGVLAAISEASMTTFPRPGYPSPLGRAHEAARLTAFDAHVIRDQVIDALRETVPSDEFERLLRLWAFQPTGWEKTGQLGAR